jgi:hypothetical protein
MTAISRLMVAAKANPGVHRGTEIDQQVAGDRLGE